MHQDRDKQRPQPTPSTRSAKIFEAAPRDQLPVLPAPTGKLPLVGIENGRWKVQLRPANLEQIREIFNAGADYVGAVEKANSFFLANPDRARMNYLLEFQTSELDRLDHELRKSHLYQTKEGRALLGLNAEARTSAVSLRAALGNPSAPGVKNVDVGIPVSFEQLTVYAEKFIGTLRKHQEQVLELFEAKEKLESSYRIAQTPGPREPKPRA